MLHICNISAIGILLVSVCGCSPQTEREHVEQRREISSDRIFGVNYLAPFSASYAQMRHEKINCREAIRKDVAQFVRLGLNGIRVHYFDREISTPEGGLVENEHLVLMDELIALCASNRIKTVVTLISAWPTPCDIGGFASRWTRKELASKPEAIAAECRFAKELVCHINPFTGKRYADDPAIAAFELFNEPAYPKDFPDAKVTEFINCLADSVRASGTQKPIYFNCWRKKEKASAAARIDGVSGSIYPTGLDSGAARIGNCLSMVRRSSIRDVPEIRNMKKMIYEFDAADVSGAYMFPAMARQFCAEGIEMAFQFHYIATDIAPRNLVCRTHHLNLFHTPAKAISLAIAAEVFRSLPHGERFEPVHEEMIFPPFRIVPSENLSEMVTERDFLYTADTSTLPPAPEKLVRVWGCGSSKICESTGNGSYFLDRMKAGVWRLQLSPSVLQISDPYSGKKGVKTSISTDAIGFTVRLADLGEKFFVWSAAGKFIVQAKGGNVRLDAGDYVLAKKRVFGDWERKALCYFPYPPFEPPPPRAVEKSDLHSDFNEDFGKWNFFKPSQAIFAHVSGARIMREDDGLGRTAVSMRLSNLTTANTFAKISSGCDDFSFLQKSPFATLARNTVVVRARACEKATTKMEMVVKDNRGYAWTYTIPLTVEWRDIRIPAKKFRYYPYANGLKPPKDVVFDIGRAIDIHFGIGEWLFPESAEKPHGIAVAGVTFE